MDKQQLQARIESVEKRLRTNLESVEKKLIDLQNDIANFKAKLDEVQDEEIPDKPDFEMDEKFYYLDSLTDDVEDSCHDGDIDDIDFNMFHTEEYAQEFADKCKLFAMMLHCKWYLCPDYTPDFTDVKTQKWFVLYHAGKGKYDCECSINTDENTVYFDTRENAQKCADWLNAHWKEDGNDT